MKNERFILEELSRIKNLMTYKVGTSICENKIKGEYKEVEINVGELGALKDMEAILGPEAREFYSEIEFSKNMTNKKLLTLLGKSENTITQELTSQIKSSVKNGKFSYKDTGKLQLPSSVKDISKALALKKVADTIKELKEGETLTKDQMLKMFKKVKSDGIEEFTNEINLTGAKPGVQISKPTQQLTKSTEEAVKVTEENIDEAKKILNNNPQIKTMSWEQLKKWAAKNKWKIGGVALIGGVLLSLYKLTHNGEDPPENVAVPGASVDNTTATNDQGTSPQTTVRRKKYKPCSKPPYTPYDPKLPNKQGCFSEDIRRAQGCLGMPSKYQTGNFGPITQGYLNNNFPNNKNFINSLTLEDIDVVCGKNTETTGSNNKPNNITFDNQYDKNLNYNPKGLNTISNQQRDYYTNTLNNQNQADQTSKP